MLIECNFAACPCAAAKSAAIKAQKAIEQAYNLVSNYAWVNPAGAYALVYRPQQRALAVHYDSSGNLSEVQHETALT